jgi:hypothetical protein
LVACCIGYSDGYAQNFALFYRLIKVRAEVVAARAEGQLDSNEAYADGGLIQRGAPRTMTAAVKGAAIGQ